MNELVGEQRDRFSRLHPLEARYPAERGETSLQILARDCHVDLRGIFRRHPFEDRRDFFHFHKLQATPRQLWASWSQIRISMIPFMYPGVVSFDETWNAIKQLCPSAEFKQGDHYGETYISLDGIRYPGAGTMCEVTSVAGRSPQEAAAKMWARLMDLNGLEPLYRDLGPAKSLSGSRYELLRWNGTTWESVGFDE